MDEEKETKEKFKDNTQKEKAKFKSPFKVILPLIIIAILIPLIYFAVTKLLTSVETGLVNELLGDDEIKEPIEKPTLEYLDVQLDNQDKEINNKILLKNGFDFALRQIVDFENKELPYEVNILDNINARYLFTLYSMIENPETENSFIPYDKMSEKDQTDNIRAIECAKLLEYSKKVLAKPLIEEEIDKINISGTKVEDDKFKTPMPMGWGLGPFALKTKSMKRSTDNTEEILIADVITKKVNNKIDYDSLMELYDAEVIVWNSDLNYAKIEIVYKMINGVKTLSSITFYKN